MSSKVEIVNLALAHLGEGQINSLSSPVGKVQIINRIYDHCLKYVLSETFWSFATKEIVLSPDSNTAPVFQFSYAFSLPDGFLRLDEEYKECVLYRYRRVGKFLYSNNNPFNIRYIYFNDNPEEYPVLFIEALATYIAYYNTSATDKDKKRERNALYELSLGKAAAADSGDDNIARDNQLSSWEMGHLGLSEFDNYHKFQS